MQSISTPDNLFHDGDPTTGALGTILSAAFMNALQAEIIAPITAAGLALDPNNNGQLLAAILALIESKTGNYALDTGLANAYVVALAPAVTAYTNGLPVKFRATHANNGQSTLNAGAGPEPLLRDDGVALQPGDIPTGAIVSTTYDTSAAAFLVNSVVPSQIATQVASILGASPQLGGTPTTSTPPQFASGSQIVNALFLQRRGRQLSGVTPFQNALQGTIAHIGGMVYGWNTTQNSYSVPGSVANSVPAGAEVTVANFGQFPLTVVPQGTDKVQTPNSAAATSFVMPPGTCATFTFVGSATWFITGTAVNSSSADFFASGLANGYQKLPSQMIIQWGVSAFSTGGSPVTFPIAFPNALYGVYLGNPDSSSVVPATSANSQTGFTGTISAGGSANIYWMAIGR